MAKQKIRAGHYAVETKHGRFTSPFPTLALANEFLTGNNVKPASEAAKRYLRDLLDQHTGSPLAETIRDYFNDQRVKGEIISASDVSLAINRLTGKPVLPRQASKESVMPRAKAIAMARAALVKR